MAHDLIGQGPRGDGIAATKQLGLQLVGARHGFAGHSSTGGLRGEPGLDLRRGQVTRRVLDDASRVAERLEELLPGHAELFELHVSGATPLGQIGEDSLAYGAGLADHQTGLFACLLGIPRDLRQRRFDRRVPLGGRLAAGLGTGAQNDASGLVVGPRDDGLRFGSSGGEKVLGITLRVGQRRVRRRR